MFETMYYALPVFIVFVGFMSCEKMAFLGSIAIACIIEIIFDVIFVVVAATDSIPMTPEMIQQRQIVVYLFMVSAFILMVINEISPQQKNSTQKGATS